MLYYFYVLLSVLFLAINFCFTKIYQRRLGTGIRNSLIIYTTISLLLVVIIGLYYVCSKGFVLFTVTKFSLLCSVLLTLFGAAYALLGFRVIAIGNVSIYTLFLMVGGMALPYFFGLIFLNDPFSPIRMFGLVLMIVAIGIVGKKAPDKIREKKISGELILLCVIIFFLNGGVSIVSKIHQLPENADMAMPTIDFLMLNAIVSFCCYGVCFIIYSIIQKLRGKKETPLFQSTSTKVIFTTFGLMILGTACSSCSSYLNLIGAVHLPATVLYPMITGGSITLTVLCEWLIFKEKPSKRVALGTVLCFLATLTFL